MCKFKNSLPTNHPYYQVSEDNYHNSLADTKSTLYCFFAMNDTKFSVQGVQTRLKRNDRFEISDRVAN